MDQEKIAVVGQGVFGKPFADFLESSFKVLRFDKDRSKDENADGTTFNVVQRIKSQNPQNVIMAISANNQATEGARMIRDIIAEGECNPGELRNFVQINSVQSKVRTAIDTEVHGVIKPGYPVVVVSLHPNHGASGFEKGEKIWILTDVLIYGALSEMELLNLQNEAKKQLNNALLRLNAATTGKGTVKLIDLSDMPTRGEGMSGPEYHDFIAAYYQALFHMIRLMPGVIESDWYKTNFPDVKASLELSGSIVCENPFAVQVYQEFVYLVGGDCSIPNLLRAFKTVLAQGESCIAEELKVLKTANIKILEGLAKIV